MLNLNGESKGEVQYDDSDSIISAKCLFEGVDEVVMYLKKKNFLTTKNKTHLLKYKPAVTWYENKTLIQLKS